MLAIYTVSIKSKLAFFPKDIQIKMSRTIFPSASYEGENNFAYNWLNSSDLKDLLF